jgi:hypothetical protein
MNKANGTRGSACRYGNVVISLEIIPYDLQFRFKIRQVCSVSLVGHLHLSVCLQMPSVRGVDTSHKSHKAFDKGDTDCYGVIEVTATLYSRDNRFDS